MKYGYIYRHLNKINGKSYIGQSTQDPKRRFRKNSEGRYSYNECPALFNAIKTYGWDNFETTILEWVNNQETLNHREEFFMNLYQSLNTQNGYNIQHFSEGKGRHAESTKEKMRIRRLEYLKINDSKPFGPPRAWHQYLNDGEYKKCSTCLEWKKIEFYGKYADVWDGLNRKCKICHNAYRKRYKYERLSQENWIKSYENRQKKN